MAEVCANHRKVTDVRDKSKGAASTLKDESATNEPIMDEIENLELTEDNTDDILEINFDVDEIENSETIHLKEKTEVYYQMYSKRIFQICNSPKNVCSNYFRCFGLVFTFLLRLQII